MNFIRRKGKIVVTARTVQFDVVKGLFNIHSILEQMENLLAGNVDISGMDVFSLQSNGAVLIRKHPKIKKITLSDHLANDLGMNKTEFTVNTVSGRRPNKSFLGGRDYRFSFETMDEEIALENDINQSFSIPEGHYEDPAEILKLLNTLMVSILQIPGHDGGFKLDGKNVEVKIPYDGIEVTFDRPLAALLGFNQTTFTGTRRIKAEFPFDVKNNFYSLFVYTDIIEPQVIGDSQAQLLQVTPAPDQREPIPSSVIPSTLSST